MADLASPEVKSKRRVIEGCAGPVRIKVLGVAVELYCDDLDIACIRLMANRDTLRLWEMTAEEIVRREHIASIRAASGWLRIGYSRTAIIH